MIKHEIRWEYILVICIILGTLPCNAQSVIPMPKEMVMGEGSWDVSADTRINYSNDALTKTVSLFNNYLDGRFGVTLKKGSKGKNAIHLQIDKKMPLEAYSLVVDDKGVTIKGSEAGIFYGIQTLQQLLVDKGNGCIQLPYIMINDEPRFGYRGLMLDVARYFYSVEYVKEYIDLMARYKINRFHWHLTEDAGWRIEIKKYPELTKIGAWRNSTQWGHNPTEQDRIPHGGFYTQEQIKEIIQYAADRYITIVPEIDLPGHTMSVLATYPELSCTGGPFRIPETWGIKEEVLCLGNDKTYRFVEDVLSEVIDLFPGEYIHIGGDEAPKRRWKECPKCQRRIKENKLKDEHELQSYFIHHLDEFVTGKGRKIIGWDEILEGGLAPNAAVMSWRGENGGIAAGFLAGVIVLVLKKICANLPESLEGIKPTLIYPVVGIFIMSILMCFILNPLIGLINTGLSNMLTSISNAGFITVLGLLLGAMMAIDMGGPINKAAYVFGTGMLASANEFMQNGMSSSDPAVQACYIAMAAIMVGGMVPPTGIAVAAWLFPKKFTKAERGSKVSNLIMGASFITEGAIPFAAADPLHVIPCTMAGAGVAGLLSALFGCTLMAPHGGLFVFATVGNPFMYIVAWVAGTFVTAILLGILKKEKTN